MSVLVPNDRLEQALSAYKAPHPVHTGGSSTLPTPEIHIESLQTTINLPLQPSHASQLLSLSTPSPHGQGTRTVHDSTVRDSHELQPKDICFDEAWNSTLQTIVTTSVRDLGIDPGAVNCHFYKLLIYKKGGHFRPHTDTEKQVGMFATLVVQLPSDFRGGRLVVRHLGDETIYRNGVDDSSCSKNMYYTAFFADVEHELTPITEGHRIALVYSLVWSGTPQSTLPNASLVTPVANALRELTSNSPCQAWMLGVPLTHKYTLSSLHTFGIRALKNSDAGNVEALRRACESIDAGELEVVICIIKRSGREQVFGEEGMDESPGWPRLDDVYDADGCASRYNLRFVDVSKISSHGKFVLQHRSRPQYTGNEGAVCDTIYRAVITLMWPKQKRLEVLSGSSQNLRRTLAKVSDGGGKAAIDRVLTWYDKTACKRLRFNQAKIVMSFSDKISENRAPTALRFVLPYMDDDEVRKGAVRLVLRFGWIKFSDQLEQFLTPSSFRKLKHLKGTLRTLCDLRMIVPDEIRVKALDLMLTFLRKKRDIFETAPSTWRDRELDDWEVEKKLLTELSVELLDGIVTARSELHDTCKTKIDTLLDRTFEMWMTSDERFLTPMNELVKSWKFNNCSDEVETIKRRLGSRVQAAQVERFMDDCEYVVTNLKLPPPKNAESSFFSTPLGSKWNSSFKSFIEVAFRVLSGENVSSEVLGMYKRFLSVIPSLSHRSIASIANSIEELQRTEKCELPCIHETVTYFKHQKDLKSLQDEERYIVKATATEPPEVRLVYKDINTGIAKLDDFLRSRDIESELAIGDEDEAHGIYQTVRGLDGFGVNSTAFNGKWFIEIKKPFSRECAKREQYENNLERLSEVRKMLGELLTQKRSLPEENAFESLQKRVKDNDGQAVKVCNM